MPTIQELITELAKVDDWYVLGTFLSVKVEKLREIKASNPTGTVQQWKVDMFDHWLASTPSASWKDVISSLERLDHFTLAAKLKAKYMLRDEGQASPSAEGIWN